MIEQRPDGLFDQDVSRLKYFAHLRVEHRRSPRTAADAEHVKAKTEMLQLKLAEKRRDLVRQSDVDALIDDLVGVTLTAMSSMPARSAPRGDLATDAASNGSYSKCVPRLPTPPSARPTRQVSGVTWPVPPHSGQTMRREGSRLGTSPLP